MPSIDGRRLENLTTAQMQLVIRKATINIVNVDNLFGCYHIKPSFLVMGGFVDESKPWDFKMFKVLVHCVVRLLQTFCKFFGVSKFFVK